MARVVVYVHPTCAASYEAVKELARRGLLGRVELREATASAALREGVWSVPWILVDGRPVATDPVPAEEVAAIVEGSWSPRGGLDPLEAFAETVLHSAIAAAVAYLNRGLRQVIDEALVSAATRAPLRGLDPSSLAREIAARSQGLYERWEDAYMRALGISYVRELWWATRGSLDRERLRELATPENVGAWLLAKASIGRAGLPWRPLLEEERLERLAGFIRRGAAGLVSRIKREQERILGDEEYWRILEEHLVS